MAILLQNVGGQLDGKPIYSSGRCRSDVSHIHIPNIVSRGVLKATVITLVFADGLHINILKFVAGQWTRYCNSLCLQNLHLYPLTSSKNIWPKISVAYFTKWFHLFLL